jgi:hypothetical protein
VLGEADGSIRESKVNCTTGDVAETLLDGTIVGDVEVKEGGEVGVGGDQRCSGG